MRSDTRRLHFAVGLARSLSRKKKHRWSASSLLKHIEPSTPRKKKHRWSASSLLKHIGPSTPRQEKSEIKGLGGRESKMGICPSTGFPSSHPGTRVLQSH